MHQRLNFLTTVSEAKLALFADFPMFFAENKNPKRAVIQLQHQLSITVTLFHRLRIKIKASKIKGVLFDRSNTTYLPPLLTDNQTMV